MRFKSKCAWGKSVAKLTKTLVSLNGEKVSHGLRERLGKVSAVSGSETAFQMSMEDERISAWQELKGRLHYKVIDKIDLAKLSHSGDDLAEKELKLRSSRSWMVRISA